MNHLSIVLTLVTLVFLQCHLVGHRAITFKEGHKLGLISCVLVVHETISELKSCDLRHSVICRCRKHRQSCYHFEGNLYNLFHLCFLQQDEISIKILVTFQLKIWMNLRPLLPEFAPCG
jgi:hypothetical protein